MSEVSATIFQTAHVGLNVTDLDRSKAFYQTVFGFRTLRESQDADKRFAFLGDDQTLVLTLWEQSDGKFEAHRPGLHHLSFEVPSLADVEAAHQRLRALEARVYHDGIVPHSEGASSGGIFFEDPDGTRLEIFTPSGIDGRDAPTPGAPTCGFF